MTWEIVFMFLLLVAMLAAFVWEKIPTELTAMTGFCVLLALGLLTPEDALAVFSNAGPIAVAAMFILSAALEKCGAIEMAASALAHLPRLGLYTVLPILILTVAVFSAFINNTPVVIVFMPVVLTLAHRMEVPASKLLIPLSYASIFGGTCTLIGTSTNIIVSSMAAEAGLPPFSMFELAAVGVPLLLVGTVYVTFLGPRLLPARETISSILSAEERREYLVEAFVKNGSSLIGQPLSATALAKVPNLRVLELLRHGVRLTAVDTERPLEAGDRLLLSMSPRAMSQAQQAEGIDLLDSVGEGLAQISLSKGVIVEGLVGPDSKLIGESLGRINFRQRYRLVPMAVHRKGRNLRRDFDRVQLAYGDTLLLMGTTEAVDQLRGSDDILVLDKPPVVLAARKRKLPLIFAVIAAVVVVTTLEILPIALAAIIGCVALLLTRCLSTREAYDAINWPILLLIFSMLGVGSAMETTGSSAYLADQLVQLVSTLFSESWQPLAMLAGVYLFASILTEFLSNNATAVLLTSIAIGLATTMEVDSRPFLIAIAIGASASFATPIGYQTNTYVYGVGGYRFSDFLRIGIPLNFVAFVVTMIVIPLVWDF